MNDPALARAEATRPPSVIDTLSAGYSVVNRSPWVLLIPILLDVFLWLGPQISLAPVVDRAIATMAVPTEWPVESGRTLEELRRGVIETMDAFNVLALLSGPSMVSVPSVAIVTGGRGTLHWIEDSGTALSTILGSLVGGLLLGSLYRAWLARQVLGDFATPDRMIGEAVSAGGRAFVLMLLMMGVAILFGMPLAIVLGSAAAVSRDLLSMGMFIVSIAVMAVVLYLAFALDAVFISRVGPLQAVKNSVAVVRTSFWPTVLLLTLVLLILMGMGRVWELLAAVAPWGMYLGILGNAYIATGLLAATMAFYRDRYIRLTGAARAGTPSSAATI
ncbi:MAG: hypothetical protein ACKVVP_06350 [Chloroflexota bacterium]